MNGWWASLCNSERRQIAVGAYVLVIITLLFLVVEPLYKGLANATGRLEREERITAEIEIKARRVDMLRKAITEKRERPEGESLFSLINETAALIGVGDTIVQMTPRGDNEVALVVDNVSFSELATWLASIAREHGIVVFAAAVRRRDTPGQVSGSLTLIVSG